MSEELPGEVLRLQYFRPDGFATVREILEDFGFTTSSHGLPYIAYAKTWYGRIFWAALFLTCLVVFCQEAHKMIEKFVRHEKIVQIQLKFEPPPFPAVTICNLNPYKQSLALEIPDIRQSINLYNYLMTQQWKIQQDELDEDTVQNSYMLESLGFAGITDEIAVGTKARENLIFTTASLSEDIREGLSYSLDELILKCSYNGRECDFESDFQLHLDVNYGNCHVFNWNGSESRFSQRAGPMYGLRMLVQSKAGDYLSTTEAAGIRISIDDPFAFPFPDSFGYNAPTGMISSFGLRLEVINRLQDSRSGCVAFPPTTVNYTYGSSYSVEGCFRSCSQDEIVKRCGCGDPRYRLSHSNISHCTIQDRGARFCIDTVLDALSDWRRIETCGCKHPCRQSTYSTAYSAAIWPSAATLMGLCNQSDCSENFTRNTVFIEVYFEQQSYDLMTESEAYGVVSLFADFGGQLGLWMGFSIITLIEFFIFGFRLCHFVTCKRSYNANGLTVGGRSDKRRKRKQKKAQADFRSEKKILS